ncbi:YidH family protein [Erythrobacter sp. R86502]|uniref:YidH family protein n=1 Tax=Erythrobacter sp. R86502 TaxID=3093846 RepID=UPI0036D24A8E
MTEPADKKGLAEQRTTFAEQRTDWAEDRTIMANERTFAGWMRTGLASVGIGLGFNALFGKLDPAWLPKVLATGFILVAIAIFFAAQRRAASVAARLECHRAEPMRGMALRLIAGVMIVTSSGLVLAIWLLDLTPLAN